MAVVKISKSSSRYYSHRYRRDIWFPVWVVEVDGKLIVGDCDMAFTTLRAARVAASRFR